MEAKAHSHHEVSHATPSTGVSPGTPLLMPFSPGDVIADKYEIDQVVGSGGMGYVVSATHVELGHQVALKFLRPELLVHRDLVARFAREARTAVMIKSEHVARVFDVGTLPDAGPFIAMEFLDGQDLGRIVSERGALPVEVAIDYILQACEALATAHALGIVHRDVKPENLFLTKSVPGVDIIKILDFGISKLEIPEPPTRRSRMPMIRTTTAVGSPTYMSPEQIRAADDVDARADVWALGCVLYELLCGAPAFDAPSLTQLAAKILEREPAPLRSIKAELSEELEAVVARCLAKDVAVRFQNVGELAGALCPFAAGRSRIVAERCRYVLDPAAPPLEDVDDTAPSSWNGLSTGIEHTSSAGELMSGAMGRVSSAMGRVTGAMGRARGAAQRVAIDPKRYAPFAAAAVAVLAVGVWRIAAPSATTPATAEQTFLAAPGPGNEPSAMDLVAPIPAEPDGSADVPADLSPTFVEIRAPERSNRAAAVHTGTPHRAPTTHPKAPPPAASAPAEPDVGF